MENGKKTLHVDHIWGANLKRKLQGAMFIGFHLKFLKIMAWVWSEVLDPNAKLNNILLVGWDNSF